MYVSDVKGTVGMDEKGLGKRIQSMRKQGGLTQQDLCQKADLSYSTLAKIERGAIKTPSVFTIQGIARALNMSLDELLGDSVRTVTATSSKRTTKEGISFVYFDVNGCLVHSFQNAFEMIAADTGASKDIIQTTYTHYNDLVCRGAMTMEQFNEALARQVGKISIDWNTYYLRAIEPVLGMIELVEEVANSYSLGLLTNIMPGQIQRMRDMGKLPQVAYDTIVESCLVKAAKPDADMFLIAQEQAGVQPHEILLIDDTHTNLQEAEKHGWHTQWFDDYFPAESIAAIKTKLELV